MNYHEREKIFDFVGGLFYGTIAGGLVFAVLYTAVTHIAGCR